MKHKFLFLICFILFDIFSMSFNLKLDELPSDILQEIIGIDLDCPNLNNILVSPKPVFVMKGLKQLPAKQLAEKEKFIEFFLKAKKLALVNKYFCKNVIEKLYYEFRRIGKNLPRMHVAMQLNALWWIRENFEKYKSDCEESDLYNRIPIMIAIQNNDLLAAAILFIRQKTIWPIHDKQAQLTNVYKLLVGLKDRNMFGQLLRLGKKPIFLAIIKGDELLIEILLKAGTDPNQINSIGATPLIYCLNRKCRIKIAILKKLIEYGANVNFAGTSGWGPIIYAVRNNDLESTQVLLDNGAKVNENKETILNFAKKNQQMMSLISQYLKN